MTISIEELNKNIFKQNKITFKKYLGVILAVYYQQKLSDGIVDKTETARFIQFLRTFEFSERGINEKQAEFKNFELVRAKPTHVKALEKLAKTIKKKLYIF